MVIYGCGYSLFLFWRGGRETVCNGLSNKKMSLFFSPFCRPANIYFFYCKYLYFRKFNIKAGNPFFLFFVNQFSESLFLIRLYFQMHVIFNQ